MVDSKQSGKGVATGARTRDTQIHNLVLCLLSYSHHGAAERGGLGEGDEFYRA